MKGWMRPMYQFARLSWKMKLMFVVVYLLMGLVRMCIVILPFKYIAPILGQKNQATSYEVKQEWLTKAAKLGFIINKSSHYTLWESKCLVRAITALLLLRLFRIPSTLYLGMAKDESNKLIAHAWLRCGELIITGAEESKRFKSVMHFASGA